MDTLGFEPRAFRMRSGCDTTTPCAQHRPCVYVDRVRIKCVTDFPHHDTCYIVYGIYYYALYITYYTLSFAHQKRYIILSYIVVYGISIKSKLHGAFCIISLCATQHIRHTPMHGVFAVSMVQMDHIK